MNYHYIIKKEYLMNTEKTKPFFALLKDTGLVKVSILEHFMFFAYLYSSCTVLFNVKTASFCQYS